MPRFSITAVIVLLFGSSSLLAAQRAAELEHGARVRVHSIDGRGGIGYVESLTADSLTFLNERSGVTSVWLDNVSQIEASAGKSHGMGALRGTLEGLIAGALVGSVGAGVFYHTDANCSTVCGRGAAMTIYGILFGIGGAASGAVVGAAHGSERWNTIDRSSYAPQH